MQSSLYKEGEWTEAYNGQRTNLYDRRDVPVWGLCDKHKVACCYSPKQASDGLCQSHVRYAPNGRCKKHGGPSQSGAGHHNAKHLKTSKAFKALTALPERYRVDYDALLKNPELTNVKPHLAKLIVRSKELERSLDNKNIVETLRQIQEGWNEFDRAVKSGEDVKIERARRRLDMLIAAGADDSATWDRIFEIAEKARKLIETDTRVQAQAQNMIPLSTLQDYTMRLIHVLRSSVLDNCNDKIERTNDDIRDRLIAAGVHVDQVNLIMGTIAPVISNQFISTGRLILSDTSKGVGGLYSTSKQLEAPTR
jgi:hypothetical protein